MNTCIGVFAVMWSIDKEFSTHQTSGLADDQGDFEKKKMSYFSLIVA